MDMGKQEWAVEQCGCVPLLQIWSRVGNLLASDSGTAGSPPLSRLCWDDYCDLPLKSIVRVEDVQLVVLQISMSRAHDVLRGRSQPRHNCVQWNILNENLLTETISLCSCH